MRKLADEASEAFAGTGGCVNQVSGYHRVSGLRAFGGRSSAGGRRGSRTCSLISSSQTSRKVSSCPTVCGRCVTTWTLTDIRSAAASGSAIGAGRTRKGDSRTTQQRGVRLRFSAGVRRDRHTPCGWCQTRTRTKHRLSSSVQKGSLSCLPRTLLSSAGYLGWATTKLSTTISPRRLRNRLRLRGSVAGWQRDFRSTFHQLGSRSLGQHVNDIPAFVSGWNVGRQQTCRAPDAERSHTGNPNTRHTRQLRVQCLCNLNSIYRILGFWL